MIRGANVLSQNETCRPPKLRLNYSSKLDNWQCAFPHMGREFALSLYGIMVYIIRLYRQVYSRTLKIGHGGHLVCGRKPPKPCTSVYQIAISPGFSPMVKILTRRRNVCHIDTVIVNICFTPHSYWWTDVYYRRRGEHAYTLYIRTSPRWGGFFQSPLAGGLIPPQMAGGIKIIYTLILSKCPSLIVYL
jgi:hypothetical protein